MRYLGLKKNIKIRSQHIKTIGAFMGLLALCFNTSSGYGQKKSLDHSVYDSWQSIGDKKLSNNGSFLLYSVNVQEGDKTLFIESINKGFKEQINRGEQAVFTSDSKFLVFSIKPFYKDQKAVKAKKMKDSELVKDTLGILNLDSKSMVKIPMVKSFKIPAKGGALIAYVLEKQKDSLVKSGGDKKEKKDKKEASTLVYTNLVKDFTTSFEDVVDFYFDELGTRLVFTTKTTINVDSDKVEDTSIEGNEKLDAVDKEDKKDAEKAKENTVYRVYSYSTQSNKLSLIAEDSMLYTQFNFDKKGKQWTFIATKDDEKALVKSYTLYYVLGDKIVKELNQFEKGMPNDWVVSENYTPVFSENGEKLFFGIAPMPIAKDTTLITLDHAVLDIWHYNEDYLQPQQLANLEKDLKKSFLAVYGIKNKQFVTLATDTVNNSTLMNKGNSDYVLNRSDFRKRVERQWDITGKQDYFLTNTQTGKAKTVVDNLRGTAYASPFGNYIVYINLETGIWYSYDVKTEKTKPLNTGLNVSFLDEEFDMPDVAYSYGINGWTDNDATVLIRDRYDIWEFDLKGDKPARMITNGFGRKEKIQLELLQLDDEKPFYTRKELLLAVGFNTLTKDSGLYSLKLQGTSEPKMLRSDAFLGYNSLIKAKDAEVYAYVKSSFVDSPNIYTTDLKTEVQRSATNQQQIEYNWGTSELVHWTTPKGFNATGVLFKPENFDATKEYPMIVYFYEKLSDNLNRYEAPAPTPSRLNISYFISNGYLVFTPDISYIDGYPGKSAEEYINSGVDYLKDFAWVDSNHIGIQGQSWGGYQVAHLITVTDRYAAAWSGAPVVNMTSAYGGIRWQTGMSRQFQYEKTQSRIGEILWDNIDLYLENSPLFAMNKVTTPVVIMHNDNDGAVPWYQGIEMFMALRRLQKPVWMLNYNGDEHNLMKRENRKDIQIRQQQFFDHYLKGAAAPVWMVKGVPATMKGKTWGFELVNE
ncbi:Prolyl oligopeptidase family protein [Myroides guanonis]|uniref:Prolyl oligopeptidase family protein n=2 Tax=Myroides guanonis TaxID=1150112 RepID=A0A1I3RUJ7_9FLAO|nr:Prolyl oligopeptidase family protein [Myroides guanonis]